MNQKIVFKDKVELQVSQILTSNKFINGVEIEGVAITFNERDMTFEDVKMLFNNTSKLAEIDIFDSNEVLDESSGEIVQEWVYNGTLFNYSILSGVKYQVQSNSYCVEIEKENDVQLKLKETEAGLLELAELVSELLI